MWHRDRTRRGPTRCRRCLASRRIEDDGFPIEQETGSKWKRAMFAVPVFEFDNMKIPVHTYDRAAEVRRHFFYDQVERRHLRHRTTARWFAPVAGKHVFAVSIQGASPALPDGHGQDRHAAPGLAWCRRAFWYWLATIPVSYTHLRAHETGRNLVC